MLRVTAPSIIGSELSLEAVQAKYVEIDKVLNQSYASAKLALPERIFNELQRDQKSWLDFRDGRAEEIAIYEGRAKEGAEKSKVEYWQTMIDLTRERIEIIEGWKRWDRHSSEWEGVWKDGQGGVLKITQGGSEGEHQFAFVLDVVRGPTYYLGKIGGTAEWNGGTARFTVKEEGQEAETWLTFIKRDGKLEIIGENTSYYHGARAYFEGSYVRTAEISAQDRDEILAQP